VSAILGYDHTWMRMPGPYAGSLRLMVHQVDERRIDLINLWVGLGWIDDVMLKFQGRIELVRA
jgi:hypothetical protein